MIKFQDNAKCGVLSRWTKSLPVASLLVLSAALPRISAEEAKQPVVTSAGMENWIKKCAEAGDVRSQGMLGEILYQKGGPQAAAESVRWFRKAAEQGNASAQYNLGVMYHQGLGLTRDRDEAVKWFRRAAEGGNSSAQYALGETYSGGRGLEKDPVEAIKWYRKAAEQGNADAQGELGFMYWAGRGVARDYLEAVKWYRLSADQGDAFAQYNLGVCYLNGYGVRIDITEGKARTIVASILGNENATKTKLKFFDDSGLSQKRADAILSALPKRPPARPDTPVSN